MPTVIVYWSPGRTAQQKADVIREMTDALVNSGGARREDVVIIFQEIAAGNSGRAGVVTAPPPGLAAPASLDDGANSGESLKGRTDAPVETTRFSKDIED
jgi:4-oxalocrotonate tautomerase